MLEDLRSFLSHAPTSWHAGIEISNRLASKDFSPLNEQENWALECGKKYFVIRGGSLCAFSLPASMPKKMRVVAAHTDSPALKLKPNPESFKENMVMLSAETYGAPLLSSWLNRDLGLAGRVVVADKDGHIEEKLIYSDDAPLFIPQLAIHLDREVNEKGLILNKQKHLTAIAALKEAEEGSYLETLIRKTLSFHTLLSFDLFLVPIEESRFLGSQGEMLASYRLDNLASSHACTVALGSAETQKKTLQMGLFWDHEEVGSRSSEGAGSPFFLDVLERIALCLKMNNEQLIQLKSNALGVSVDMAHALNPNYEDKHEPLHKPLLGKGIVLKYNADQKYASNALGAAHVIKACHDLHLPYQNYVVRSDLSCGSTVGSIFAGNTGILTVDIGCPQLSMHSTREVMACSDHIALCQLLTHLLSGETK